MQLSEQQIEMLKRLAAMPEGQTLLTVLDLYSSEIKDDVLNEKLDPKAGRSAIGKLDELRGKLAGVGAKAETPKPGMFV